MMYGHEQSKGGRDAAPRPLDQPVFGDAVGDLARGPALSGPGVARAEPQLHYAAVASGSRLEARGYPAAVRATFAERGVVGKRLAHARHDPRPIRLRIDGATLS